MVGVSVRCVSAVFEHSEAQLGQRLVMFAIADAAQDDGIAWEGFKTLGEKTRMHPDAVRRCARNLVESGELQVAKARWGRSSINVYRVVVGDPKPIEWKRLPPQIAEAAHMFVDAGILPASNTEGGEVHPDPPSVSPGPSVGFEAAPFKEEDLEPCLNREDQHLSETGVSDAPPKHVDVGGRNEPLDALAEICGIAPKSRRMPQAVVALNGRKGKPEEGIRWLYWQELRDWAEGNQAREATLAELHAHPEQFAAYLAKAIRKRDETRRVRMSNVEFGPQKFRDWFVDLAEPAGGESDDRTEKVTYVNGIRLYGFGEDDGFSWGDGTDG